MQQGTAESVSIEFAVTGMERSGTQWTAVLLNDIDGLTVLHEPLGNWDARVYHMVQSHKLDAEYWARARWSWWNRTNQEPGPVGEVSAFIRYGAAAIRDAWEVPVVAIVRDGPATVRSLLKRGYFTKAGVPSIVAPRAIRDDPVACCSWLWADAYSSLLVQGIPIWRLEDLNTNYREALSLARFLGYELSFPIWERRAGFPKGVSLDRSFTWEPGQQAIFNEQAGHIFDHFYGRDNRGLRQIGGQA